MEAVKVIVRKTGEVIYVSPAEGGNEIWHQTDKPKYYRTEELDFDTAHMPYNPPKTVSFEGYVVRNNSGHLGLYRKMPTEGGWGLYEEKLYGKLSINEEFFKDLAPNSPIKVKVTLKRI